MLMVANNSVVATKINVGYNANIHTRKTNKKMGHILLWLVGPQLAGAVFYWCPNLSQLVGHDINIQH